MTMSTEKLAHLIAAQRVLAKQIGKAKLPAGYSLDLSGQSVEVVFHPDTVISRENTEDGTGQEWKIATQHTYGFTMLYAFLHYYASRLAKFKQAEKAEKLMLALIGRIVRKATAEGCTSEAAFKELHPRLAEGVENMKEDIRKRLPKIPYTTPQKMVGDGVIKMTTPQTSSRKAA